MQILCHFIQGSSTSLDFGIHLVGGGEVAVLMVLEPNSPYCWMTACHYYLRGEKLLSPFSQVIV